MKFDIKTVATVPATVAPARPNAHEFPWAAMEAEALATGEVATITIPDDYWAERGDDLSKVTPAERRSRIRNSFNGWVKATEKANLVLDLATGDKHIDAYLRIVKTQAAA